VAVVADGSGSATFSEEGARLIAETMADAVESFLPIAKRESAATVLRFAAAAARAAVIAKAEDAGRVPRDYAATLLAVLWTPAGGAALQRGDGLIATRTSATSWQLALLPQRGEYANVTFFLTDNDALDGLETVELAGDVTDVALTSDGLETLALQASTRTVHAPMLDGFADRLIRVTNDAEQTSLINDIEKMFDSHQVRSRTDDDLSLVLATRRAKATELPKKVAKTSEPSGYSTAEVDRDRATQTTLKPETSPQNVQPPTEGLHKTDRTDLTTRNAARSPTRGDATQVKPAPRQVSDAKRSVTHTTTPSTNAALVPQNTGKTSISIRRKKSFWKQWFHLLFSAQKRDPVINSGVGAKSPQRSTAVKIENTPSQEKDRPGAGKPRV